MSGLYVLKYPKKVKDNKIFHTALYVYSKTLNINITSPRFYIENYEIIGTVNNNIYNFTFNNINLTIINNSQQLDLLIFSTSKLNSFVYILYDRSLNVSYIYNYKNILLATVYNSYLINDWAIDILINTVYFYNDQQVNYTCHIVKFPYDWTCIDFCYLIKNNKIHNEILSITNGGTGTNVQFPNGSIVLINNNVYSSSQKLFWDNTNSRLGINTTTPQYTIDSNGPISISQIGATLHIASGSNAAIGTSTLVNGIITIYTTAVTSNSNIFLNGKSDNGGLAGFLRAIDIIPNISFTVISGSSEDVSTFSWVIIDQN